MNAVIWHRWFDTSKFALITVSMNAIALLLSPIAIAQLTPDLTLGSERSTVRNAGTRDLIEGGARRNSNLFHSFEQFNINNGQRLYFANPDGISNIISRVTGRNPSNILGTLGVEGNANLFFLNPNGIFFGQTATLDMNGSFVATTANRLQFGNQGFFDTNDSQAPPLLTVNPSALLFNQLSLGKIQTESIADAGNSLAGALLTGLRVADGQNLLLIGGDVTIAGGLHALGGQLQVIAAAAPATVDLNSNPYPSVGQISSDSARANVLITERASLRVRADRGGEIQISARDIRIEQDSILRAGIEQNLGNPANKAGDIVLNATGNVEISGRGSLVSNALLDRGTGGDVVIRARSLVLEQGATLNSSTISQGNAGRVIIQVAGPVVLKETATIFNTINPAEPRAIGNTGGIFLEADSLTLTSGAELVANTEGIGNVGDVVIQVRGNVTVSGVDEQGDPSGIFNVVRPGGVGRSGTIRLSADSLSILNGARLQTNTNTEEGGKAGDVRIRVQNQVLLDSPTVGVEQLTGIYTAIQGGKGQGGDIDLQAGSLTVLNGAQLTANTFAQGNAGNITIAVKDRATFDSTINDGTLAARDPANISGVFSAVGEGKADGSIIPAFGNGGNISISGKRIEFLNGAALATAVSSGSRGDAGKITVTATDQVIVDGRNRNGTPSRITAQLNTDAIGNANDIQITTDRFTLSSGGILAARIDGIGGAGNLRVNSRLLEVLSEGQMQTTTSGSSAAGNINLVSDRINLSGQNSGVFANAEANAIGRGGDINVNTQRLTSTLR